MADLDVGAGGRRGGHSARSRGGGDGGGEGVAHCGGGRLGRGVVCWVDFAEIAAAFARVGGEDVGSERWW